MDKSKGPPPPKKGNLAANDEEVNVTDFSSDEDENSAEKGSTTMANKPAGSTTSNKRKIGQGSTQPPQDTKSKSPIKIGQSKFRPKTATAARKKLQNLSDPPTTSSMTKDASGMRPPATPSAAIPIAPVPPREEFHLENSQSSQSQVLFATQGFENLGDVVNKRQNKTLHINSDEENEDSDEDVADKNMKEQVDEKSSELKVVVRVENEKVWLSNLDYNELFKMWMLNEDVVSAHAKTNELASEGMENAILFMSGSLEITTADKILKLAKGECEKGLGYFVIALMFSELVGKLSANEVADFVNLIEETNWIYLVKDFVMLACKARLLELVDELKNDYTITSKLSADLQFVVLKAILKPRDEDGKEADDDSIKMEDILQQLLDYLVVDTLEARCFWKSVGNAFISNFRNNKSDSIFQLVMSTSIICGNGTQMALNVTDEKSQIKVKLQLHRFVIEHWEIIPNDELVSTNLDLVTFSDVTAFYGRVYSPWSIPKLTIGILRILELIKISKWSTFLFGDKTPEEDAVTVENLDLFLMLTIQHRTENVMNNLLICIIRKFRSQDIGKKLSNLEDGSVHIMYELECIKSEMLELYRNMRAWAHKDNDDRPKFIGKRPPADVLARFASVKHHLNVEMIFKDLDRTETLKLIKELTKDGLIPFCELHDIAESKSK